NQLFQYMLALAIKFRSGVPIVITGLDIPSFGINKVKDNREETFGIEIKSHIVPLNTLSNLVKETRHIEIKLSFLSSRMAYYTPHIAAYKKLIKLKGKHQNGYDEKHIVINVRGGEILTGAHKNYMPIPIFWYEYIIRKTGLKPVFIGQLGDDKYSNQLKKQFPDALYPKFESWEDDFNVINTSVNIIPAVSTFSWLASWLSETAKNIYFPVMGLYHPLARPDIDMLPFDDMRYHFTLFDIKTWHDVDETIEMLISSDIAFEELSGCDLIEKFPLHLATEGLEVWK
ncbi:TPA: hypothetical protein OCY45_003321, partial [Escherichia coli]|nr:hypothetical protein [Escherichia coli]